MGVDISLYGQAVCGSLDPGSKMLVLEEDRWKAIPGGQPLGLLFCFILFCVPVLEALPSWVLFPNPRQDNFLPPLQLTIRCLGNKEKTSKGAHGLTMEH